VEYQYFPGCSLHGTAREYGRSLQGVVERLGIELTELEGWSCCGATAARSVSQELHLLLAARNLALAQGSPAPLMVACNLCYSNLAVAAHSLRDEALRRAVNASLRLTGLNYAGETTPVHALQVISEVGAGLISAKVVSPLHGLRVASYYGCLLTRPRTAAIPDSNFNPTWLDTLMAALGAETVPLSAKTKCCGGPLLMTHPEAARGAAKRILDEAKDLGTHCIAVSCPQCHLSLGEQQSTIERRYRVRYGIRIAYFTELIGQAIGIGAIRS